MRRVTLAVCTAIVLAAAWPASGQTLPQFVNGLIIPGDTLDATRQPGANAGRLGMFSDLYYGGGRCRTGALAAG